jgi:hypothetical protein
MPSIDRAAFRDTLLAELRAAWLTLQRAHPAEQFYAFGIYTAPLAEYLMVTASTEEGLSVATAGYLAKSGGDPALMRASLRWSPCDSPLHEEGTGLLPASERLRNAGPDPYEDTQEAEDAVTLVFDVAVEALKQLDDEGLFGAAADRSRLVLGIWIGDQSDAERIRLVAKLNPKPVVQRFEREVEAGNRAFTALHSRDAKRF